jgi:hypothetical protein
MTARLVEPAPIIGSGLRQQALVTHARRVADLTRLVILSPLRSLTKRATLADLIALGVAFSQAVDLGIIESDPLNWREVSRVAFPAGGRNRRFREAIHADTPHYEASRTYGAGCPISGPRGGRCTGKNAQPCKWVTDMETGAWEYRDLCPEHEPIAFARHRDAPLPAANRGGILADVFPEWDMDSTYKYVTPAWEPAVGLPAMGDVLRPKLRVVAGGVA